MSNVPATLPSGFNAMTTNVVVTMDDVVSAFVSKYEAKAYEQKKLLSAMIVAMQQTIEEHTKAVLAKIDPSSHVETLPYGLVAEANKEVHLDWDKGRALIEVSIRNSTKNERTYYSNSNTLNVTTYEDLDPRDVEVFKAFTKTLANQQAELAEVLDKIKSIGRKEREVRGRIAMRKIEESGYSSLLDDGELLQLVQL